jgi:hypothetical protein
MGAAFYFGNVAQRVCHTIIGGAAQCNNVTQVGPLGAVPHFGQTYATVDGVCNSKHTLSSTLNCQCSTSRSLSAPKIYGQEWDAARMIIDDDAMQQRN